MTKHEIEQELSLMRDNKIIDGFAPVCRGELTRFYVMIYVKFKDYKKERARSLTDSLKAKFPNLDIGVGTITWPK